MHIALILLTGLLLLAVAAARYRAKHDKGSKPILPTDPLSTFLFDENEEDMV